MRRHYLIWATVAALTLAAFLTFTQRRVILDAYRTWQRGPIPEEVTRTETITATPVTPTTPVIPAEAGIQNPAAPVIPAEAGIQKPAPEPEKTSSIPSSYNLKVVFIPQAPLKVWDELHEDSCEEASMLMVNAYQRDVASYTPEEADDLIIPFVEHQTEQGDGPSISSARALELMKDYLGLKTAKLIPIDSIDDIKEQIALGRPVILPAAGKLLFNPNFKNGGPLYHMLVAKGYTEDTIITNDPGTRLGANYAYQNDVLWNAIHDWNGGDVENGARVMIIVE
jgi:Peptidase_C39 like family